jgi:hypothetical protein
MALVVTAPAKSSGATIVTLAAPADRIGPASETASIFFSNADDAVSPTVQARLSQLADRKPPIRRTFLAGRPPKLPVGDDHDTRTANSLRSVDNGAHPARIEAGALLHVCQELKLRPTSFHEMVSAKAAPRPGLDRLTPACIAAIRETDEALQLRLSSIMSAGGRAPRDSASAKFDSAIASRRHAGERVIVLRETCETLFETAYLCAELVQAYADDSNVKTLAVSAGILILSGVEEACTRLGLNLVDIGL